MARRRNRFIFTTTWIVVAALICVIRPTGTLRPGIIMFLMTPFLLIADIIRQRFGAILSRKAPKNVQVRDDNPSSST